MESDIVILSGARTAIGGFGGSLSAIPPTALAAQVAKAALASSDQAVVDKAAADLSAAIAALQKAETPTKPDTGDGDNKGDNAGDKTGNKTDDTKSDGKLPATGAAVYGVSGAMVLLAAAGIALSIWRKRRA